MNEFIVVPNKASLSYKMHSPESNAMFYVVQYFDVYPVT